ncbi:MAG: type III-B CRISPR module-associated protein Cmr5 [Bryobacteraceae bacterium]|nr:type III-B CRISPR module-associated protein Cmr5 [Bryobacteraceae bacterium]
MNERNLSRARARFAFDEVERWPKNWRDDATQRVRSLPVQVRTQGLPVVLAILLREDKSHSRELAGLISRWVLKEAPRRLLIADSQGAQALLAACLKADRQAYLAAQAEALAILEMVKLFADALSKQEGW